MFIMLPLAIVALFLFGQALSFNCGIFREFQEALLSARLALLAWLVVWCGTSIFLKFSRNDLLLIGLLFIGMSVYLISYAATSRAVDAIILLAGVMLGKSAFALLRRDERGTNAANLTCHLSFFTFLVGLVGLLAFSSWWHLEPTGVYRGSRWMGLWDNPNIYGMLMGAGMALAIGLLAANAKFKIQKPKANWLLGIAVFMLGVGLVMSYSRGAWLGAAIGLLYLAWSYGKLKWRYVLTVVAVAAAMAWYLWGSTPDSAPWYVKRADLGRPSAQNRATAWRAGLEIMRDYPLDVGWNNAVKIYERKYSPPEGGPGALTTNDYLMLGTELGIAALLCFVTYCVLCLRGKCRIDNEEGRIQAACRAGAIVLLVAFWFDGGLFKLATASVFWVLLELGASNLMADKKPLTPP